MPDQQQQDQAITAADALALLSSADADLINDIYLDGVKAMEAENLAEAVNQFEHVLALDPEHVMAIYQIGEIGYQLNDKKFADRYFAAAVDGLRKVLRNGGLNDVGWLMLADALCKSKRRDEAAAAAEMAVADRPTNYKLHRMLADRLVVYGIPEKALPLIESCLDAGFTEAESYAVLGKAQAAVGRCDEAAKCLETAIGLDPSTSQYYELLARLYRRSNLTVHKSAEVCRRGLAVAPSRDLYDELSGALRLFARFDEAAEVLRQGQQFSKDRYGNVPLEFWFQLGEVLKLAGRRDEALQAHETTLALCEILNQTPKPKKDVPMRMLAFELRTLWAMGRREEAMGKYQEIRQGWDPTNYIYELEHHAPDTPARLDRLAEVIGGRDVFVLMHGPSVAELEARIGEFADRDICFMTAHGFALFEERMLGRIGRQCDLAMVTNPMTMLAHFDQLEEFLRRDGDNLLLTGRKIFDLCERDDVNGDVMIDRYDDKLMLFPPPGSYLPPSPECPLYYPLCNTLSCMLPFLVLGGARRVFLFGCDGTSREAADGHHRYGTGEDSYRYQPEDEAEERMLALNLLVDTLTFDEVADLSLQSAAFLYNRPIPPIHNVSPGSHLQLFPKIDVDGCLAMLDGDGTR